MREAMRSFVICLILGFLTPPSAVGAQATADSNPLAPFARLMGGEWYLGDDSYHAFEWGVGKKIVHSKSYFVVNGSPTLVSEGVWFWHPGNEAIEGYATAVQMPVEFFEYETRFIGDTLISDVMSYGPQGGAYRETWEFLDENRYVWTLYAKKGEGLERAMGGTYVRRP